MAEHEFSLEFRGVMFDVCVGYHNDDPRDWILRSAKAHGGDANFAGFLLSDNRTAVQFNRLCDAEMYEFRAAGGINPMDAAREKQEAI